MRLSGNLVQWNDARGFGFIAADDGSRYFVHISAIGRIATRPREGDRVSFLAHRGPDGRAQAKEVVIAGANPLPDWETRMRGSPPTRRTVDWRYILAAALALALLTAVVGGRLPWASVIPYAAVGLLSALFYGLDKSYAEQRRWRISEVALHGLDLGFGIIGGLVAQAYFRHKTRKPTFVTTTVLIAAVHMAWLVGIAFGWIGAEDFLGLLG